MNISHFFFHRHWLSGIFKVLAFVGFHLTVPVINTVPFFATNAKANLISASIVRNWDHCSRHSVPKYIYFLLQ